MAFWERVRRRYAGSSEQDEAAELRHRVTGFGLTPIADTGGRTRAEVYGVARSITHPPRTAGPMSVVVELYDGTGVLDVVWLGRREVPGIRPGVHLRVRGLVGTRGAKRVMFNPAYEIVAVQ